LNATAPALALVSQVIGLPLIIQNFGVGAREEDALTAHPITGRYRWALAG
jgi:uncharacterized protein YijF (DUF1287 family)